MIHPRYIFASVTSSLELVKAMQRIVKYALPSLLLIVIVAIAGTLASTPASAQSSSGQFNPQTQFSVGTKLSISSIYGLETAPLPFSYGGGFRNSGQYGGQNGNYGGQYGNYGSHSQFPSNQQWNLTYLRNIPTANSSVTITAEVTNDTQDGGILWTVQSGTITYNGTTLTVSSGIGGIGKLNRLLMAGNATEPNGNTLRWNLEGLATLYGGTVIVALTGSVGTIGQNPTSTTYTQTYQNFAVRRQVSLTYIATIS